MKKLILSILPAIFLACGNLPKEIDRIVLTPELITDSLETRMPGTLIKSEDYIVWFDPFSFESFLKIVDPETGRLIGEVGKRGQGPNEFSTPSVDRLTKNRILIADLNADKQAVFSIDDWIKGHDAFVFSKKTDFKHATRIVEIEKEKYVALCPIETKPFNIISHQEMISFGKYPIDKEILNRYEVFQGELKYNRKKNILVYSVFYYPYMAVYKKNRTESVFDLVNEMVISKPDFSIVEGEMRMKEKIALISEIALTKDYIVAVQRSELKGSSGTNQSIKPPGTLYLYDYKLNLLKIVDVQVPVLRIASDEESNTIFAIVINPEYSIVKVNLH